MIDTKFNTIWRQQWSHLIFRLRFGSDLDNRKSSTSYICQLNRQAITWCSQKQDTMAISTTDAEFLATCESVKVILVQNKYCQNYMKIITVLVFCVDYQRFIKLINFVPITSMFFKI